MIYSEEKFFQDFINFNFSSPVKVEEIDSYLYKLKNAIFYDSNDYSILETYHFTINDLVHFYYTIDLRYEIDIDLYMLLFPSDEKLIMEVAICDTGFTRKTRTKIICPEVKL